MAAAAQGATTPPYHVVSKPLACCFGVPGDRVLIFRLAFVCPELQLFVRPDLLSLCVLIFSFLCVLIFDKDAVIRHQCWCLDLPSLIRTVCPDPVSMCPDAILCPDPVCVS
jgi:hypothetical protein